VTLTLADARGQLATTAACIRALAGGVDAEQARWKPAPEKWSILEVVNHLADEEVEDFRTRLDLVLHRPGEPWPPIDPQGWVAARGYAGRELGESLDRFARERERSLAWLQTLADVDWERAYVHPAAGPITAGSLLASWVAHDLLHIRQVTKLRYDWLAARAHPHSPAYAGPW
jgi:DinB superfamily